MAGNHSFYYEAPNYVYHHGHGTAGILKCHIVKMKTANLFVSKRNLLSCSNSDDFQNRSEVEIAIMKCE